MKFRILENYAYHYYDVNFPKFMTLKKLPYEEAVTVDHKGISNDEEKKNYLKIRNSVERMMLSLFISKGGKPKTNHAHYFAVNDYTPLSENFKYPCCLKIPISCFDKNTISFTYNDSFKVFFNSNHPTSRMIYTIDEIDIIINKYSLPTDYIEMQLWDDPHKYDDKMIEINIELQNQYMFSDITKQQQIDEFEKYKSFIISKHYLFPEGIHGTNHVKRVLIHCINLADLNRLDYEQKNLLYTAAVYHDIGREFDGIDLMHGFKSYKKADTFNLLSNVNENDKKIIKYLIENHSIDDDRIDVSKDSLSNYLLNLLKDADALDRVRINDLNKKYLRNPHSERMINIAWRLLNADSI